MVIDQAMLISIFGGALLGAIIAAGIIIIICFAAAFYIYFALAWYVIAKKMKYKMPWLAWVPFANTAMVLQLGKFSWALAFLYLIPVLGWIALLILCIIAKWRIFEKRKYPGWLSLSVLIPQIGVIAYAIILGFVAWKDNK